MNETESINRLELLVIFYHQREEDAQGAVEYAQALSKEAKERRIAAQMKLKNAIEAMETKRSQT